MAVTTYLALAVTDADPAPMLLDGSAGVKATWDQPALSRAAGDASATMALTLRITGANQEATWNALARKLYADAPAGAGGDGLVQANLVLIVQLAGAGLSYIDVVGVGRADRSLYRRAVSDWAVTLLTRPYARGAPVTLQGLAVPAGGGGVWLGQIKGTYPAYARVWAADTSANGKRVVSFLLGQRAGSLLTSTDQTPIMDVVPQTPGAAQGEATARGGTASKLTLSAAMQAVCRAAGPATGRHNGRMRVWGRLRSSAPVIGRPGNFAATASAAAGTLGTGDVTALLVPYGGSAPYVAGVNALGTPSELLTNSLRLVSTGGSSQMALNPLFYDDFELGTLERWIPGKVADFGTSTAVITASAKDTGTYGMRLTATTTAGTLHQIATAPMVQSLPALPASKKISVYCRLKITTETNQDTLYGGLRLWIAFTAVSPALSASYGLGSKDGVNWGLYRSGELGIDTTPAAITLVGGIGTFTLAAGFHDIELTYDGENPTDGSIRLTVDGTPRGGEAGLSAPRWAGVGAVAYANGAIATEVIDVDTFSIDDGYQGVGASINGFALTYTWDAALRAGGYLLKFLSGDGGTWNSFDAGNVTTYTLATMRPTGLVLNSPPPSVMPSIVPAQCQLYAGVAGSALRQPWAPVQTIKNGSIWEWRDLGAGSVPPLPVRLGEVAPPWDLELRALGTVGETLECDALAYCDDRLDKTQVEQLALAAPSGYMLDTGPSGTPGAAVTDLLTASGTLITDANKYVTGMRQDDLVPPAGVGVWPATTNINENSDAVSDATGATAASNCIVFREATYGPLAGTCYVVQATAATGQVTWGPRAGGRFACSAGTTYTASRYLRSNGAWAHTLVIDWYNGAGSFLSTTIGPVVTPAPGVVARCYATGAAPGTAATMVPRLVVSFTTTGQQTRLFGCQEEAQPFPTPPVRTTTGQASRAAGRLRMPLGVAGSLASGALSLKVRMGVPTSGASASLFAWCAYIDANNWLGLYYACGGNTWVLLNNTGGSQTSLSVAAGPYVGGEVVTLSAYWVVGTLGLSVNGATYVTAARGAVPVGSPPALVELGQQTAATNPLCGNIAGLVSMRGTPTQADAAALAAQDVPLYRAVAVSDNFERTTSAGTLGSPQTGGAWSLTGGAAGTVTLDGHRMTIAQNTFVYATQLLAAPPVRLSGTFSISAGAGSAEPTLAILSTTGWPTTPGLALVAGCHFIMTPSLWAYEILEPGWTIPTVLAQGAHTLATDGTLYSVGIQIVGNTVTLELPDGSTATVTDPRVGPTIGPNATFELITSATSTLPHWDSVLVETPASIAPVLTPAAAMSGQWDARTLLMMSDAAAGQAAVSAPFRIGPGNVALLCLPSVADGAGDKVSDIDAGLDLTVRYVPLYDLSAT